MSVDAGTLEVIEVDVNLDDTIDCYVDTCDNEATWRGTPLPCRHSLFFCSECKEAVIETHVFYRRVMHENVYCTNVGAVHVVEDVEWSEI